VVGPILTVNASIRRNVDLNSSAIADRPHGRRRAPAASPRTSDRPAVRSVRCGQRLAPHRRAPGRKLSAAGSQHRPQRETEGSSGAARRAALARPPAGRMGAGHPLSSAVGPPAAAAGRSTGVPDRLFGRCERLLRRPPRRGHAAAAAARLASTASSAPSQRAARAAARSRPRMGRGAGSARPSPGARRVCPVDRAPQQAAARSSSLRRRAAAPRRAVQAGARRASATRRRWWWRAPRGALCAGRGRK